jgi:homospermidine synthase
VNSSPHHLLIIGYGSVSQCALPLIIDFFLLKNRLTSITIIDALDLQSKLQPYLDQYNQIKYYQELITKDNYEQIFEKHLSSNDIFLDLAFNLETRCLLKWCHDHNIRFVNTSVELWDPFGDAHLGDPRLLTLYHRQMQLIDMKNDQKWNENGPTAIIDHGCNPGLVSHFIKRALIDMTEYILHKCHASISVNIRLEFEQTLKTKNYPKLAYLLDIKTIHISERDTQITNQPKKVNEFVNTWSVDGLTEEAVAPSEMAWGTHERNVPEGMLFHDDKKGPCNLVCLTQKGMNTWVNILFPVSNFYKRKQCVGPFMGTKWRNNWNGDKTW